MKIKIEEIKKWIDVDINESILAERLTKIGFESFIIEDCIDISIPSNRSDCYSLFGLLTEISALFNSKIIDVKINKNSNIENNVKIKIFNKKFCNKYCGKIIKNINNNIDTPDYIRNILIQNEMNLSSLIVDIANYVTILTGQPLHIYDLDKIENNIILRNTKKNEEITLLNYKTVVFTKEAYVITNGKMPLSIPGIIGCDSSKVDNCTNSIYIESAIFDSNKIKEISDYYNIHTYSSTLFRKSIDPKIQEIALELVTYLILKLAGGHFSNTVIKIKKSYFKKRKVIKLYKKNIAKILGMEIDENLIRKILISLNMKIIELKNYWKIIIPIQREDLVIEENIINEILRYYGLDNITSKSPVINMSVNIIKDGYSIFIKTIKDYLVNKGYNEIITYSFVDKKIESIINKCESLLHLKNPISETMNVMRSSLLQGLLERLSFNIKRNHEFLHFFEYGRVFFKDSLAVKEIDFISGICTKNRYFAYNRNIIENDFFKIKNIVEQILNLSISDENNIVFERTNNYLFDSNESSSAIYNNDVVCNFGILNKEILSKFQIKTKIYYFEINLDKIYKEKNIIYSKFSKYPSIKRDLSILINKNITYYELKSFIIDMKIEKLKAINFSSVYSCESFGKNIKSITLTFIFQDAIRSLTDEEINKLILTIIEILNKKYKIVIRGI
ncbi:MAG TPA: phenylalanine--tRNA ligase subunit beta [Candidatus Azoamicus sp. OHIO1]